MVTPSRIDPFLLKGLHTDVLPSTTKDALLLCTAMPLFGLGGWYLAGGTALALQAGHRQSVDLDFFTTQETFDAKNLAEQMSVGTDWRTESLDRGTLYGEFCGAKMSFIAYPFFKPTKSSVVHAGNVSLLTPADIAVMKVAAISQRGRKRDFVDMYWLCNHTEQLLEIIKRVDRQYTVRQNPNHILKSLVYFADAEIDPMPKLFFDITWNEIKKFFQKETTKIARGLLKLD